MTLVVLPGGLLFVKSDVASHTNASEFVAEQHMQIHCEVFLLALALVLLYDFGELGICKIPRL